MDGGTPAAPGGAAGPAVPPGPASAAVAERIGRDGSIRFDEFVGLALSGPGGFFTDGGGAGRRGGDFLTSPEVGPLFGAVVARYLDDLWDRLGRPDPFVVVEGGAGRGALVLSVLAGPLRCRDALRWVLVETSPTLRARQGDHLALAHPFEVLGPVVDPEDGAGTAPGAGSGPLVCSLEDLPAQPVVGAVLANELLDNLPPRLVERTDGGWAEVRVTVDGDRFVELLVPADPATRGRAEGLAPRARPGARLALLDAGVDWVRRARAVLAAGELVAVDYGVAATAELAERPWTEWLRTYRSHGRSGDPLEEPGSRDVTCEVAVDQLAAAGAPVVTGQADWLRRHGIEELVAEGRRDWDRGAAAGDLAALRARSRVAEAEALVDPAGLGAFLVLTWPAAT